MKTFFKKCLIGVASALVLAGSIVTGVLAEDTYTANTMRLLHYEGSVDITEASGESGVLMENLRFNSGATLHTGEESSASIGMDSSKIVTLDQNTTVEFTKKNKKMKVKLSEGNLLLDVKEKLKDDETLDIETSNMAVGIRGTAVVFRRYSLPEYLEFLKNLAAQESGEGQNAGQNNGTQTDPQANGLSDINQMIEDLEKEIEQLPDGGVNAYVTVLGILEGSTNATYTDSGGQEHSFGLESGKKVTLIDTDNDGHADKDPIVNNITAADLTDKQQETIDNDSQLKERIKNAGIVLPETSGNAGNQDVFATPIIVTAQSASKMFDGTELTYTSDVVVEGVPAGYTYKASATGSQTDAGQGDNPVDFHIYDTANNNADVTGKFTNVTIIPGVLTVDPAPLHAWSGSASKVYDGTPLTSNETKLTFSAGYEKRTQAARNLSYVVTEQPASSSSNQNTTVHNIQTLYGISGTILVHGSNPITGETLDIPLAVGERLTVYLYEKTETTESTIEYKIDKIGVGDIPNQILRLYRDNPDLVNQACIDAGWDLEALQKRLENLPAETEDPQTKDGINYPTGTDPENMMQDSTNVRINIDTDLADYKNRALDSEEAHFRPMKVDSQIKIVTKASITDVGSIPNEFEINWGNAKETNYILTTEFGTLTVTEAPLTVKTGSAEKEYDGEPLTNSEASISGLVHGETASVTATGTITKAGSTSNSYSLTWGSAKSSNYSVSDSLGTLKVTANDTPATITISVSGKTYDGTPLSIDTEVTKEASSDTVTAQSASGSDGSVKAQSDSSPSYTISGLPDGFGLKAKISGTRTDAGSGTLTVDSYTILDTDGNDVTDCFSNIVVEGGALTIDKAEATVTTGSASKEYDGTALTDSEASISGLVADETATVTATGSVTNVESKDNTYSIDWGETNKDNYSITDNLGTLKVTKNKTAITFTAKDASKTYDGKALTEKGVTASGIPEKCTFTASASGSQTDAGSSANTVSSYKILDGDGNDVTSYFSNISTADGTLTVNAAEATVTTGSATKEYDGTALTDSEASITGLVTGETATVTANGSVTNVESKDNTYSIDWGDTNKDNYTLTENLGTLEVTENTTSITFTGKDASKTYDGTALTEKGVTASGIPEKCTFTASASGTQTDAGSSANTVSSYTILDGDGNDVTSYFTNISTVDGTLTVNAAEATVTTGSASKAYDGTALTDSEASISGLVTGETATVTATGTVTNVESKDNTYTIDWGETNKDNYSITENLGTLEVTTNNTAIVFTVQDASKTYDGTALEPEEVTATGVPDGLLYYADFSGSQTDVGSSAGTASACYILDAEENDVTSNFTNISSVNGTLTVNKASVTITTEDLEKAYDGTALSGTVSVTGLADTDKENVTVTATASIIDVGSTESTYTIDWGSVDQNNYTLTEEIGTLTVTKNDTEITFTSGSDEKTYDGTPLINNDVTVENLPSALSFKCSAGGTVAYVDAGTWDNMFNDIEVSGVDENGTEYSKWVYAVIKNSKGEDVTDNFTNIKFVEGTLTINPLPVTFDLNCDDGVFDGWTYLPDGISGEYEDGSEVETESLEFLPVDSLNPTSVEGTFNLTGGGQVKLTCEGKSDAGDYTITPTEEFLSGTAGNYDISYINNEMSISPLELNVDLGSPVVDYDGKTHGGTITLTYGNGYNEGDTVTPTEATSNDTGSSTAKYTLYTGPTFKVSAGCDGPDAGTYTLSCKTSFESTNENNYSVTVTGNTLTINATTISEELNFSRLSAPAPAEDTDSSGTDSSNGSSGQTADEDAANGSSGNDTKEDAANGSSGNDTGKDAANSSSGNDANEDASSGSSGTNADEDAANSSSGNDANKDASSGSSSKDADENASNSSSTKDADENAASGSSTKDADESTSSGSSTKDADENAASGSSTKDADENAANSSSTKDADENASNSSSGNDASEKASSGSSTKDADANSSNSSSTKDADENAANSSSTKDASENASSGSSTKDASENAASGSSNKDADENAANSSSASGSDQAASAASTE